MAQNMKSVEAKKFGFDPGKPNLFASPAVMVFLLLVMLVKVEPSCASGHQSWRKRESTKFFFSTKRKSAILDSVAFKHLSPALLTTPLSHNWTSSGPTAVSGTCKRCRFLNLFQLKTSNVSFLNLKS